MIAFWAGDIVADSQKRRLNFLFALGCFIEGNGLRAITCMTGKSINTVTKLLVDLGTACAIYQNETLRNLPCRRVQVDESVTALPSH